MGAALHGEDGDRGADGIPGLLASQWIPTLDRPGGTLKEPRGPGRRFRGGIPTPAAAQHAWEAEWIGAPAATRPAAWYAFRKRFTLSSPPPTALARIACDTKYWLWINGRLVVFEGQLKRGPTPEDTYYDSVDLGPYLRAGENTIAVLVWYWGAGGLSHRSSGTAGLVFEADIGGVRVASDPTWRARLHPAYGDTEPPHPNSRLSEPNIRFDARQDLPGWNLDGYDDTDWSAAVAHGRPPTAPWNRLLPRPIPLWRTGEITDYESIRTLSGPDGSRLLVARLPHNAQVTPYLEVDAPAGLEIDIRTDTYTGTGATSVRAVYVTRDGVQAYESFGWMNGHEVGYTIPPGVEVLSLGYRETGYDADFAGHFTSDDPTLNTLWEKARRTLYVTMRDTHMDCPDRERAQYAGDLTVEMAQAVHALDAERGPLLARKGLLELVRWRRDGGIIASPVPHATGVVREIPMQGLAAVGWYGLWRYFMYTGDREALVEAYPAVRDYLGLWRLGGDGLVVHREGDWDWADWYGSADVPVLENAWYYLGLKAAVKMAEITGHADDIPGYRARMESIETAFDRAFWTGEHYRSPGHPGGVDDRGNAMAVVAGLAKPAYFPTLVGVLGRYRHASPYMEKYVVEALYLMDAPEAAVERMKGRWAHQVSSPLSTLWEFWEWQDGTPGSYNHGWGGGPLPLLSRYAAGVAPTAPGFESFAVMPRMGPLTTIDVVVPTPVGAIDLGLRREPEGVTLRLTSPEGTRGVAGIPVTGLAVRRIEVNGETVWRQGAPTPGHSPVRVLDRGDRWIRLAVPGGSWEIRATGRPGSTLFPGEVLNMSENPGRSGRLFLTFRERPTVAGVYTLGGRRVVDLLTRMSGSDRAMWDLTNARGGRVAPGIYLLIAEVGGERVRRKLIVTRGR